MILPVKTWGELNPVRRTPLLASIRTEISRFFPRLFTNSEQPSTDALKKMDQSISDGSFVHRNLGFDYKSYKKRGYHAGKIY